ncbi:MAG TPA: secretin N-terminal domain-containing protein [Anaerohalosphaeraceae bacterium]|nr:secretin N-terminal domain-containing protein [Anaerohalosphaeraceae bacterium]HOL88040.1 secretin N-terminal domain-containing protein [Anaerohalosphaeraceae bacterium]HPP55288.1 secretin N-terminal domain-containing protein [Anaerohalosphaeraceae bacterium]
MEKTGNKTLWKIILPAGLLLLPALAAWGQDAVQTEDPAGMRAERLSPVQQRMQQTVSVDFRDTPIDDVLRILARQANVDIIKSPKVEGTVTATLNDVPLGEALTNILEAHGYSYVATENMIRVMPTSDIVDVREKVISRVYRITYADVKDVEAALRKFVTEQGSISANPGTSNIIVTDVESKIKAIDSFIEEIDRITPQILVEAKIYDISSRANLDLGVEWQMGTNTLYDLEGTSYSNGTAVSGAIGNAVQGTVTNPAITSVFSGDVGKTSSTDGIFRFGILNDHVRLDAALKAKQEDIRAKLLANPRILVLDNVQAEIKIVEEFPYQELTESSGGGSIGTTAFREVGIELRVVPHLTRDGLIRLLLNPKFSVRTGEVVITGISNPIPQPIIASRETMTTALIRDGQTVVIGGLKKQDVSQQINKIPLLGNLPLVGFLFRSEGESTMNSELVIFITPTIVKNPILSEEEQRHLANTVFSTPQAPQPRIKSETR